MSPSLPEPELITLEPQTVAVVRESVPLEALPDFFSRAYHAVMAAVRNQGAAVVGPPVGIYFGMPSDVVDVAAGFPVDVPVDGEGLRTETLPGGPAVRLMHQGPYDTMRESYGRLTAWLAERELTPASTMWESYLTDVDPGAPEATLTQITWPVTAAPPGPGHSWSSTASK